MVEYHHPEWNRQNRPCPPPLFLKQTCSEVGEEFSPIEVSLPEEVREIFFLLLFNYMCNIYKYVPISSKYQSVGGSAEQSQQDQDGRALNQPRPHLSDRIR